MKILEALQNPETKLKWKLEGYWALLTLVVTFFSLYPILRKAPQYQYVWLIVLFVVVSTTLFRYIFFLKYTPVSHQLFIKAGILTVSIPSFFLLIRAVNAFLTFADIQGIQSQFEYMTAVDNENLTAYVKSVTLFFGTAATLLTGALPFRMMVSIWRQYNKKGSI